MVPRSSRPGSPAPYRPAACHRLRLLVFSGAVRRRRYPTRPHRAIERSCAKRRPEVHVSGLSATARAAGSPLRPPARGPPWRGGRAWPRAARPAPASAQPRARRRRIASPSTPSQSATRWRLRSRPRGRRLDQRAGRSPRPSSFSRSVLLGRQPRPTASRGDRERIAGGSAADPGRGSSRASSSSRARASSAARAGLATEQEQQHARLDPRPRPAGAPTGPPPRARARTGRSARGVHRAAGKAGRGHAALVQATETTVSVAIRGRSASRRRSRLGRDRPRQGVHQRVRLGHGFEALVARIVARLRRRRCRAARRRGSPSSTDGGWAACSAWPIPTRGHHAAADPARPPGRPRPRPRPAADRRVPAVRPRAGYASVCDCGPTIRWPRPATST